MYAVPINLMEKAEQELEELRDRGTPFEEIEDFISEQPLTKEQQSVLWLLAWAERPRSERRSLLAY